MMGAFRFTLDGRRIAAAASPTAAWRRRRSGRSRDGGGARRGVARRAGDAGRRRSTALGARFEPLDDQRASAAYRALVARNVLFKALTEIASGDTATTRLVGARRCCRRPSKGDDGRHKGCAAPSPGGRRMGRGEYLSSLRGTPQPRQSGSSGEVGPLTPSLSLRERGRAVLLLVATWPNPSATFIARCRTTPPRSTSRALRTTSTISASRTARSTSQSACRRGRGGGWPRPRSRGSPRRASRRRRAHRRRHPRQERRFARLRRRPDVRRATLSASMARPCSPSWRRPATPPAAPSSSPRWRSRRAAERHRRGRARSADETVLPGLRLRARATPRRRSPEAPHRLEGSLRDRRPGALLPRRPGRARDPGRGRRDARPLLDPASDRGAARRRPRARRARFLRHLRGAPHGRRLRRQGEPGDAMGRARRARRPRHRPPLQGPARPRRRLRPHRQAPRLPLRLARRLRREAAASQGYAVEHLARCGYSADLSQGVVDRTMFHSDNAYFLPAARIGSRRLKTNTVSNTAFRGFGGPQGMLVDRARARPDRLGDRPRPARRALRQPLRARARPDALRHGGGGDRHPPRHRARRWSARPDYRARRAEIAAFNAASPILKRGIALTPVKFGISFTLTHLNQAGALVHVYQDGSVHLNHGGTEMGQGLYVKVAQVVAEEFGIALERVRITATTTGKVPNTSPTAASAGSDLNGMAAAHRGARHQAAAWRPTPPAGVRGAAERGRLPRRPRLRRQREPRPSASSRKRCVQARVQLSEAGFYRTPEDHLGSRQAARAGPFFYFAYGAACAEAIVDTLTGENRVTRVDILHDCGQLAEPGDRHRPDRGRLRPGHGLADHRGAGLRRRGAAPHPRALDLQDPGRLRRAGRFPRRALSEQQSRGDDLPLEGGRRAAADAREQRLLRARRRDPRARAGPARAPRCAGDPRGDPARLRGRRAGRPMP